MVLLLRGVFCVQYEDTRRLLCNLWNLWGVSELRRAQKCCVFENIRALSARPSVLILLRMQCDMSFHWSALCRHTHITGLNNMSGRTNGYRLRHVLTRTDFPFVEFEEIYSTDCRIRQWGKFELTAVGGGRWRAAQTPERKKTWLMLLNILPSARERSPLQNTLPIRLSSTVLDEELPYSSQL